MKTIKILMRGIKKKKMLRHLKVKLDSEQQKPKIDKSLFKRFLNNGFDGISTNPNYKMLALLIILLINLSLFFVIGMQELWVRNYLFLFGYSSLQF